MSEATTAATTADIEGFYHVRIVMGVVTGLSVTRLLGGLSRFIQQPEHNAVHLPHLVWTLFLLLYIVHFWWFEFALQAVPRWQFQTYLFHLGYAALIFFIAALLFPDKMVECEDFADYFQSRRRWFYGLLALLFLVDMADTLLKGREHFLSFGLQYPVRQTVLISLALIAMVVKDRRYHLVFATGALLVEIWWIFAQFRYLD